MGQTEINYFHVNQQFATVRVETAASLGTGSRGLTGTAHVRLESYAQLLSACPTPDRIQISREIMLTESPFRPTRSS